MNSEHDTSFEPFSRHDFYRQVNRELVELALRIADAEQPLWATRRVVDLGCGTGSIARLVLNYWRENGRSGELIALDPSASALERAKAEVHSPLVRFVESAAEALGSVVSAADVVLFFNAIHLVENKGLVLAQVRDSLSPRGIFAFNTAFYDGSYVEGTQRFYRSVIVKALKVIRENHPDLRTHKGEKPAAMRWMSAEQYCDLLRREGFMILHLQERRAEMPLGSWIDIAGYTDFAAGALPGVSLDLSIPALRQASVAVFEEMKLTVVPRNWLQVVAQCA